MIGNNGSSERGGARNRGARTFLHFRFAIYATFVVAIFLLLLLLLLYMSSDVDLRVGGKADLAKRLSTAEVCEHEMSSITNLKGREKPRDEVTARLKRELYEDVLAFQQRSFGAETLPELLRMRSRFGNPNEASLRRIVESYSHNDDSRISFVSSDYNFKYYGRFQMALQSDDAEYVYVLDDDMIPGARMLEILCHVAGTDKYGNAALGSIGRILPFRQKDLTFPRYCEFRSKEAGLSLPDRAYDIAVDRIVQVDFLSSSWFLPADLLKTLFIETPLTFATGEDLHLSYQLQKYVGAGSFVLPVDAADKATWGDTDHRLAYVFPTTSTSGDMVRARDEQWWRALTSGYVTQWAAMHPQKVDALMYAHTLREVRALAPLLQKFRSVPGREAYLVVSGGCEEAAAALGWPEAVCKERRFSIFDLGVRNRAEAAPVLLQAVYAGMRGIVRMLNPSVVAALDDIHIEVKEALRMAANDRTVLVLLPRRSVSKNRAVSLRRLLTSLRNAYYLGDEVPISFNMDAGVDAATLKVVDSFDWPHGPKSLRRRIAQAGLIRAVTESWYPSSDHDYGLLLEDDVEVSRYYYLWVKYALLAYRYDPAVSLPELSSISLYTPRLVEVVKERPQWNATDFFGKLVMHPNTPYLHQLPCSWGAVFFPKHWREFYAYMAASSTEDKSPVQIPGSRTNGWQGSWKKFLIEMMYMRGYVTLYPNFPNQTSFSTNHMEPGVHIGAKHNVHKHRKIDYEVPLLDHDFTTLLPMGKMPPASELPVLNLFNQAASIKGLKAAGAKLGQDVLSCEPGEIVAVDYITGLPRNCTVF
ncbi:hypothetical protein EJB05_28126, partial [Eragrostis curvula]